MRIIVVSTRGMGYFEKYYDIESVIDFFKNNNRSRFSIVINGLFLHDIPSDESLRVLSILKRTEI